MNDSNDFAALLAEFDQHARVPGAAVEGIAHQRHTVRLRGGKRGGRQQGTSQPCDD